MNTGQDHIQIFNVSGDDPPVNRSQIQHIVTLIGKHEKCTFSLIEVVFVDKEEIVRLNRVHLDRDYVTDVITFPYDENDNNIEGTIFICVPRVYEQAIEYNQEEQREFLRIVIHGLLHLAGYHDGDESAREEMRERENFYLDKLDKSGVG